MLRLQGHRRRGGTDCHMRSLPVAVTTALTTLVVAASAHAAVPHTVAPGETLWSIAAANNFTTRSLAAFNGLSEDSSVTLGSTVMIPAEGEAAYVLQRSGATAAPATTTTTPPQTTASAPAPMGGYTVQPGDTLSGLAAQAGVPARQIAWMNGLSSDAQLVAGTSLKLPTGAPGSAGTTATPPAAPAQPTPAAPQAAPYATTNRMSSSQVGSIAAANGVPSDLASAVAYQESGFNNDMVSPTSARGIMQIMPGTWDYVQHNLSSAPLNPGSASDNVRAGSLYLASLLRGHRRGRSHGRRGLLPGPRLGAPARPVRRHEAVREQRARAAGPFRGLGARVRCGDGRTQRPTSQRRGRRGRRRGGGDRRGGRRRGPRPGGSPADRGRRRRGRGLRAGRGGPRRARHPRRPALRPASPHGRGRPRRVRGRRGLRRG